MARVRHDDGTEGHVSLDPPVLDAQQTEEDRSAIVSLRPTSFADYVGQRGLVDKMSVYVEAAQQRNEALDHVLLHGPPGLGKTTMAVIIAKEMGVRLHSTSGPAVEHKGILAGLLTGMGPRELLFIDEIHRLSPTVEESLYSAMEDGRMDIPVGEGSSAVTHSIALPPFTLVGATTRTALLTAPLRDRFQIIESLEFYNDDDLATIVSRTSRILGMPATPEGAFEVGRRSRGTPRIANRLTRRIRDFCQVEGDHEVSKESAAKHLRRLQVDDEGLNAIDRRVLTTILNLFGGGPVGIDALSASIGVPRDTLEDVNEPFLLQRGFLVRTPRGRMTTEKAVHHVVTATPGGRGR